MAAAARDVQAKGRLQPWNSKGCRPEGVVAAASNALTREGYVQAGCNAGTLTAKELGRSCREGCAGKGQAATLVEAAAEGLRGFRGLKAGKRQARMP